MAKVNIKPLGARVLVKPLEAEEKTESGLIIPDSAKEKPQQGIVMAVGKGTNDEEMEVKEDDKILYGKFAGTEVTIEGEDYLLMNQTDILAVI